MAKNLSLSTLSGVLTLAVWPSLPVASATQGTPPSTPASTPPADFAPGLLEQWLNRDLPDAIGKARITLDSRLRWEYADQGSVNGGPDPDESNAVTLRTRFGLTSGLWHGFGGMLEGENVTVLGPSHNYNAAGSNGENDRTVIADPPTTELNQSWLSYTNWDSTVRAGRQRLVLDNARFVGDVNWRQNQQTYDAVVAQNQSVSSLRVLYAYLWEVNRVYGDVPGLPAANQDFRSDSHLVNVSYGGWKPVRLTAYTYLLELENASPASSANSTATYGLSASGTLPLAEKLQLAYRAEAAWQTDYGNSLLNYQAEYYALEAGVKSGPLGAGLGYEVLGTDNGQGFRTPLATLHAFNGWADVFLTTPTRGLRDLYPYLQVTLPGAVELRVVYHTFASDSGGADFGQEIDVQVSRTFGKHWAALGKYAHYEAADTPYADVNKAWLQLEFFY